MDIQKNIEAMKNKIASQLVGQLTNQVQKIDLHSILAAVGLQVAKRSRSLTVPMIGAFGAGLAVGALFTPMSGKELRQKVWMLVSKSGTKPVGHIAELAGASTSAEDSGESPYDKARNQRDSGGANGQKKGANLSEVSAST